MHDHFLINILKTTAKLCYESFLSFCLNISERCQILDERVNKDSNFCFLISAHKYHKYLLFIAIHK